MTTAWDEMSEYDLGYMAAVKRYADRPTCGLCRNCRWWGPARNGSEEYKTWRECTRNVYGSYMRSADDVITDPDFGCVQWDAKDDN